MLHFLKKSKPEKVRGGVLLTTLVLFLLFIVMMVAAIDYINQQYKAATDQEETQKAFHLAEAGVDYTMFLLGQHVTTMSALKIQQTSAVQTVNEPGTTIVAGTFINIYTEPTAGTATEALQVTSHGTVIASGRCDTVVATLEHLNDQYSLVAWDHVLGCGAFVAPTPTSTPTPTPTPTATPTPTPSSTLMPSPTPTPSPFCGDGICNGTETSFSCMMDCGGAGMPTPTPTPSSICGDGICSIDENSMSCPMDCGGGAGMGM